MQLTSVQLKPLVINTLRAGLVPMIAGSPAVGKSDLVRAIAKELNLFVIDHRLSTSDPTDLSGLPKFQENKASFIPFDIFPLEGDKVPKGYDGFLLFLDEINSAPMAVQAAAYRLLLDREVGQYKLHERCVCIAAGNLQTDGAIVNRLGTAMQSRMIHFEMVVDAKSWLAWAAENKIDYRITSFINYAPNKLQVFDPNHNDKTFAAPRTWHFLSRYLDVVDDLDGTQLPAIAGTIGEGIAREFLTFCDIGKELPQYKDIVANPDKATVPSEPSTLYFLCGVLSDKATKKEGPQLIKYISRLPLEFQIICFRDMLQRNPELRTVPEFRTWMIENAAKLRD